MRRRLVAGGMLDHETIGLLSILFAVVVGLGASVLSLLLRWPGLAHSGPTLHAAGRAHVPLLVFFSAIPASLGGLAVASIPGQIGSRQSSLPWLSGTGLGLSVCALAALGSFVIWSWPPLAFAGVNLLALAIMLTAANLVTTILNRRAIAYADLPNVVWTTLIASVLAVCTAPMAAASCTSALWAGAGLETAVSASIWPALCVVLVLLVGLVDEVFAGISKHRTLQHLVVWLLTIMVPAFFILWASGLLHRIVTLSDGRAFHALLGVSLLPIALLWAAMLFRASGAGLRQLAVLFAIGFAIVLPVGLLTEAVGWSGHEAASLAIVFGLFAGYYRLTAGWTAHPLGGTLARLQFWFLLGGTIMLMLPLPASIGALWAAMLSLSVGLFAAHLILVTAWRHRSGDVAIRGLGVVAPAGQEHHR